MRVDSVSAKLKTIGMKMNKVIIVAGMVLCSPVFAAQGDQALSIGFAQMNADGVKGAFNSMSHGVKTTSQADSSSFGASIHSQNDGYTDPQGGFIRYRYELTNEWGIITSATYATFDGSASYRANKALSDSDKYYLHGKGRVTGDYFSVMAGPTWRINDLLSVYAMTGLSYQKVSSEFTRIETHNDVETSNESTSSDSTKYSAVWSLGAQANVWKGLIIDAAYEGAGSGDWRASGFTIGLGYKF